MQVGHDSVIPLIISYIEGKNQDQSPVHASVRKAAMYSLMDVASEHRHSLLPVYLSILNNPAESRYFRIAAVASIMKMQPTTVQLQKIAVSTWSDILMQYFRYFNYICN